MLNMIRMDFYRMIKTKSFYMVLLVFLVMTAISTVLCKTELEDAKIQQSNYESTLEQADTQTQTTNVGISVILPTKPGEKASVYDMFYANVQGKEVALFLVIFAVMFSLADFKSGFIKNIGGQARKRFYLIASKTIVLTMFTVILFVLFLLFQALCNQVILGYLKWGDTGDLLTYFGTEIVLHAAFAIFIMALSIIIQSNAASMILAIVLSIDLAVILYSMFDRFVQKHADVDFHIMDYLVTGKISALPMAAQTSDIQSALLVSAAFIAGSLAVCGIVFQKRDMN